MFQANQSARPSRVPGTIELEISDPVLILNEIARRYETTERVLMEYVDNALDDAEALYRENEGSYPYPITIEIDIDYDANEVTIKDNCRGMSRQLLERVVKNIGESQKRGVTWVNGRFGFGVQAFRAAAGAIRFFTKQRNSSAYVLELQREQQFGIKEARRVDDAFPTSGGTGTIITLTGFDADWANFSAESVKAEIESHFERLIARPGLTITVSATGQPAEQCAPFDYTQLAGEAIRRTFEVDYKDETYPIEVYLLVAHEKNPQRAARFFVRGRCINEAAQIKSFIRKSSHKTRLWGHPNLLGYIEVGELVQPAITRDDFDRTKGRQLCYEAILSLEPEINKLLRQANKAGQDQSLATLETAVNELFARQNPVAGDAPSADAAASDTPLNLDAGNDGAGSSPEIQFVSSLPDNVAAGRRAYQHDDIIYINLEHPDFKARLSTNRHGGPKITDRLNAYLACIISTFYLRPNVPPDFEAADVSALFEAQLDRIINLEATLHSQQANLKRALAKK